MMKDEYLFKLLCPVSGGALVVVYAFESKRLSPTHTYIDIQVRVNGEDIFPRGALYCGIPNGTVIDGISARECVLSTVAMKPGDTDSEYFEDYTDAQRAFAEVYGEELSLIRQMRYCDENGNPKGR